MAVARVSSRFSATVGRQAKVSGLQEQKLIQINTGTDLYTDTDLSLPLYALVHPTARIYITGHVPPIVDDFLPPPNTAYGNQVSELPVQSLIVDLYSHWLVSFTLCTHTGLSLSLSVLTLACLFHSLFSHWLVSPTLP
jgi:hypothetical protein